MTQDSMGLFLPDRQIPGDFLVVLAGRDFPSFSFFFSSGFSSGWKGWGEGKGKEEDILQWQRDIYVEKGKETEDGESKKREIK